jgi:hypothetical protein
MRCLNLCSALHKTLSLCACLLLLAGQIAYALAPLIASGQMLGPDTPVLVQLYDVPAAEGLLQVGENSKTDSDFKCMQLRQILMTECIRQMVPQCMFRSW